MAKKPIPVGIDLGTTFSSLAYVDDQDRVEALRLPEGGFTVASAIYFKSLNEIVIGSEALNYTVIAADRVARTFKRYMGDPQFSFAVDDRPFRPEELSAMIVKKLIAAAREQLGEIGKVVISVPFVFEEKCRRATQDAARIAGIGEVDLVDEPVAAALAYGHTLFQGGGLFSSAELKELFSTETVLVYDLGGGTFDATVMRLGNDGDFQVLATGGDHRLGGEDWDNIIVEMFREGFEKETSFNPQRNKELMQELRMRAVEAKKSLSERKRVEVPFAHEGKNFALIVTLGDFERKSAHLLDRTEETLDHMLTSKDLNWNYIDKVLMVGGSSRMPMVRKMLERVTNRYLDMSLPPDIAIAKGAALYAALKSGDRAMRVKTVKTVNSHSLGLLVKKAKESTIENSVLLKANEPTLTRVVRSYRIQKGAKHLDLRILLGDSTDPEACVQLGKGRISNLPDSWTPNDSVDVGFCFQENGLLQVDAVVRRNGVVSPHQVKFEIQVEGEMSEPEVMAATATLKGITID